VIGVYDVANLKSLGDAIVSLLSMPLLAIVVQFSVRNVLDDGEQGEWR
jgi:hypothetical protein